MSETIALLKRVRQFYGPPVVDTVADFADRELVITSGPLAGSSWRTGVAPYQRGIMNVFHEPDVQISVVMGSSQWGKTACAVNVAAYHMKVEPCPILVIEPTVDPMAKDFARNRLEPVIEASPALKACVAKRRARDAGNTTLQKTFVGGVISVGGANSAASLASRPTRLLILDEVDRYPLMLPGEGSTIAVAMKRTTAFRKRRRVLMLSSPTLEGAPIHAWFELGDQRRYFVPCPACGHMHTYEWANVSWTHDDPTTARLVCPACKYKIGEAERIAALAGGEWRPENPNRSDHTIVSFHVWEAYSPFSSLADIVAGFLRARALQKSGERHEMHTWQNTTLGEPVPPDTGEGVEPIGLLLRREAYGDEIDVPDDACVLTIGVDTQDDRLEFVVVGWGLGEESWLVDRQTIPGDTSRPEPWKELEQALAWEYRHAVGRRIGIRALAIDSAGHRTDMVYHWAATWSARRVYAVIGRDGSDRPIVTSPSPRRYGQGERQVPLYTVGVDAAKAIVMSRLKLTDKGPGYIHLPTAAWCDEEFAAQLTSERLKTTFERGLKKEIWRKIRPRNEALDCYVYALAAFYQQQPDAKRRLDWLAQLADQLHGDQPPKAATPPPRRGSWIQPRPGGWLKR